MKKIFRIFSGMLFLFPLPLFGAGVALEEVLFDPEGADTGNEWIVIANKGNESRDLAGWQAYPDGIGYFTFPSGFSLASGGSVTIRLRAEGSDSAGNLYHGSASSNMGNTSGSAALFSGEPRGRGTIESFVQWGRAGETWESAADSAGVWKKGEFLDLSSFSPGQSIARVTGEIGKNAWRIGAPASGGSVGAQSEEPTEEKSIPSSSPPPQSSSPLPSSAPQTAASLSFVADAGEDKTVIAGSSVLFEGKITLLRGSVPGDMRFLWDFGDGTTSEGSSVSHTFLAAGDYRASLHVSHEKETQSDYVNVRALPNQTIPLGVIEREAQRPVLLKNSDGEKEEQARQNREKISVSSLSDLSEKTAPSPGVFTSQKNKISEASQRTNSPQNPVFSSGEPDISQGERAEGDSLEKDVAAVSRASAGRASLVTLAALAFVLSVSAAAGFIIWRISSS